MGSSGQNQSQASEHKAEAHSLSIGDWERCRPYLRLLAATGLNQHLRAKLDPSDIVQQTLLQAHKAQASFRGTSEGELMAWLKQILTRVLIHAARDFRALKRDISREIPIQATLTESWLRVDEVLVGSGTSPGSHAEKNEAKLRMCEAVELLPDSQRLAVELHHFLGWPISQVAEEMEKTPVAVAGLLKRGLKTLRTRCQTKVDSTK